MKKLYFILLILTSVAVFSQGESHNWYFGQFAGVTFNTNPPSALTEGQMATMEGCASISGPSGNLLFYTDGRTIWDKEHNVMPNADYFGGTGLMGDPSSTQSGLIIPHPTLADIYYVFTVDEPHQENANAQPNQGPADNNGNPLPVYEQTPGWTVPEVDDGFNNGLNYSIVNMSLRNGLGDVIPAERNNHLITYDLNNPEQVKFKCSEKLTAVAGADCNTIWVITHFVDRFYAFLINEDGVDETPVISRVDPEITLDFYRKNASGYLKSSPNGEKLLIANTQTITSISDTGNVFVYDYDNATGVVSNAIELDNFVRPYGVEFSPDAKKAYATLRGDIVQWDLEADDIPASAFSYFTGMQQYSLQLAPDGKIYTVGGSNLNVINNPNVIGENFNYSNSPLSGSIDLEGNFTSQGLPSFVQSIYSNRVDIINGEVQTDDFDIQTTVGVCDGDTFTLGFEYDNNATYQWFENGEMIPGETTAFLDVSLPLGEQAPITIAYTLDIIPDAGECKLSGIANVTFGDNPIINDVTLNQCSSQSAFFNLNDARADLIEATGLEIEDFEFNFYQSEENLENNNPIQNISSYQNLSNPQNIIVEATNLATTCSNTANLQLNVIIDEIEETIEIELHECDTNLDGFQEFNLELAANETSYTPTNFYRNIKNAMQDDNRILNTTSFTNTEPYSQTIYFRTIVGGSCSILGILNLRVNNIPFLFEDKEVFYCIETSPETISISPSVPEHLVANYEYFWPFTFDETLSIETSQLGTHQVLVTDISTGCEALQTIMVVPSRMAEFQVEIDDGHNTTNRIEVLVDESLRLSDYEYALGNPIGNYQDSPIFTGLTPGFYEVYVRNKHGCGIAKRTIGIIGTMPFFTPNNDGVNDYWNLIGLSRNQNASVQVFDRYGKLLVEFKARNVPGWDGTYNGRLMLNDDYWYAVHLDNGRILKGNFTLKR